MCGIVGYIGSEQAAPILLDGLSKLEYRGYDSAGVAYLKDGTYIHANFCQIPFIEKIQKKKKKEDKE